MRRFALLTLAVIALVVVRAPRSADSYHFTYLIQDPVKNPGGAVLRGVHSTWLVSGTSYNVCSERMPLPPPISLAIGDWEQVLPGVQFNVVYSCASSILNVRFATVSGDLCPDEPPRRTFGCADSALQPDAQRGGSYATSGSFIWIDDIPMQDGRLQYDDAGLRAIAAHELGHIFGLHEAYDDVPPLDPNPCVNDPNNVTIMDALADLNLDGQIDSGCDGVLGPTPRDVTLVQALYGLAPPGRPTTVFSAGPDIAVRFRDDNAAEEGYGVIIERWSGSGWIFTDSRFLTNSIAPCSAVPCGQDRTVYYRKPDGPLNDGDRRPRAAPW